MNVEKLKNLSNDYHVADKVYIDFEKIGITGKWLLQSLDNDEWLYYDLKENRFYYSSNISHEKAYLLILAVHRYVDEVEEFDMDAYRASPKFRRKPIMNKKHYSESE